MRSHSRPATFDFLTPVARAKIAMSRGGPVRPCFVVHPGGGAASPWAVGPQPSSLTLNVKVGSRRQGDGENAPGFRVQAAGHDIGAAWKKISQAERPHVSLTLDGAARSCRTNCDGAVAEERNQPNTAGVPCTYRSSVSCFTMKSATSARETDAKSVFSLTSSPLRYIPVYGPFVNRGGRTITQSNVLRLMSSSCFA